MTTHDSLPKGYRLGSRYHLEERVGVGATSTVYRALDLRTETVVALKVLDPLLARDEVSLERFARELRVLRGVTHPHVVRVYRLERDEDLRFLSMEYVAGPTLRTHLERKGRFRANELVPFGRKLASALDACHRVGVVHRDIKPGNVLLDESMEPKIVNFGVAGVCAASHLTRTGTYMGTPDYMAPEQFRRSTTDPRSDVYSLGVLLYELLTERLPYRTRSLAHLAEDSTDVEPPSAVVPEIPSWLDAVVLKCLKASPEDRYQSALELAAELAAAARSLAQYQQRHVKATCLRCGASMLEGLSFCHHCGSVVVDHFERGEHAVILYRCDDPEDLCKRVASLGAKPNSDLLERLRRLPRVLVRGLDEETAKTVASELFGGRAELSVSDKLPRELRLPHRFLGYGLLALAMADLLRGRANRVLDELEDPKEQLSLFLNDLSNQLEDLRGAVARALADEKRARLEIRDHLSKASDWERRADPGSRRGRRIPCAASPREEGRVRRAGACPPDGLGGAEKGCAEAQGLAPSGETRGRGGPPGNTPCRWRVTSPHRRGRISPIRSLHETTTHRTNLCNRSLIFPDWKNYTRPNGKLKGARPRFGRADAGVGVRVSFWSASNSE